MKLQPIYPVDAWSIREERVEPRLFAQSESVFTVGNGYLGLRGNFEEGGPVFQNGTYINGFYEFRPLIYGEEAFGYAKHSQTMLNLTDCKIIKLCVDGQNFDVSQVGILSYLRVLDLKEGILLREVLYETDKGKKVLVKSQRFVSFHRKELAVIVYEAALLEDEAKVTISSEMISNESSQLNEWDPREAAPLYGQVLVPQKNDCKDQRVYLEHTAKNSKMTLGCMMDHEIETACAFTTRSESTDCLGKVEYRISAVANKPVKLVKYMAYHASKDGNGGLRKDAEKTIDEAKKAGIDVLLQEHKKYMFDFWQQADIQVKGSGQVQQALRFNLYHIYQSAGKSGGRGISAKGLTGQGYEGHYFWDSEIYVLPFFIYNFPGIARNLLKFRYSMLEFARQRAKTLNQKGALFAWRTINGQEASAYFPASTAQVHINADIVYALRKYVEVTGDKEALDEFGAEILVETARFYQDLGSYIDGAFVINEVTGPDEYTALVNNNSYTNYMAKENLLYAVEVLSSLEKKVFKTVSQKTNLHPSEIKEWKKAAEKMYLPKKNQEGILPQDDSFLKKQRWDFKNTPDENYPLLLHYHPLVIYRRQVLKQSDLLLAMFLLPQYFEKDEIKRNFEYYDPLTTSDSSLADCVQGIIAASIGEKKKSLDYFFETMEMDLENINHNLRDGVHIASMAGGWIFIVYGFAGLRDNHGELRFSPFLPKPLHFNFTLRVKGKKLNIKLSQHKTAYTLIEGKDLEVYHNHEKIKLALNECIVKNN